MLTHGLFSLVCSNHRKHLIVIIRLWTQNSYNETLSWQIFASSNFFGLISLFPWIANFWFIFLQMALRSDEKPSLKLLPLQFPIDHKKVSPVLKFIPEFVMENVVEHILLGKRFCPQHLEEQVCLQLRLINWFVNCWHLQTNYYYYVEQSYIFP